MFHLTRKRALAPAAALVAALALGACSSDSTDAGAPDDDADATTLTVEAVDYGFDKVPDEIAAGTTLAFTNTSDKEFHEMVVMRIADGEERSVQELLELPEEETADIVQFMGVAVAPPETDGQAVQGDLTLTEAGRYVMLCFIPVGADPDMVAEAMEGATEAPDLGPGAPHFVEGMVREFTVTS
jgi:plastocyanin